MIPFGGGDPVHAAMEDVGLQFVPCFELSYGEVVPVLASLGPFDGVVYAISLHAFGDDAEAVEELLVELNVRGDLCAARVCSTVPVDVGPSSPAGTGDGRPQEDRYPLRLKLVDEVHQLLHRGLAGEVVGGGNAHDQTTTSVYLLVTKPGVGFTAELDDDSV